MGVTGFWGKAGRSTAAARRPAGPSGGYLKGFAAAALTTGVCTLAFALLFTLKDVGETGQLAAALLALGLGAAVGGYGAARAVGKEGLLRGGLTGGALFLTVTALGAIITGAHPTALTLLKGALCLALGMAGGVWGVNRGARRKMKIKK